MNKNNDAQRAMTQSIHGGAFGAAHLHVICVENSSEEQILSQVARIILLLLLLTKSHSYLLTPCPAAIRFGWPNLHF